MTPFYFLSLLLIALASTTTDAAYAGHNCSTSLAPNSTATSFKSYLNQLLSNLSSNANRDATGFYNAITVGPAYGLFLCRRDVSANACKECVVNATSQALLLCPDSQEALISYDNCTLSYSNKPFSSWAAATSPVLVTWSEQDVSQYVQQLDQLTKVLATTLGSLVPKAANAIDRFATEEEPFTAANMVSFTVYSLAQCRPDLSAADCNACLEEGKTRLAPSCCDAKQGGRVLYDSCNMRFEMYPFYQESSPSPSQPSPPTLPTNKSGRSKPSSTIIIVSTLGSFAFCVLVVFVTGCFFRKRLRAVKDRYHSKGRKKKVGNDMKTVESLQFRLGTIETATNKFSDDNKLGEGGFGAVFKGTLGDGHEIAVKRLSKSSTQGVQEFQNEVVLVAKLQHRNLVRLLGFCLEGEETLLVYEYVPNKSLDHFLFEPRKREQLDWSRRCMIIGGIARRILYLHEDSRLRVIHRDLKASNILLDGEMNPKISDFGMAKMFGVDGQTQGNTKRPVGTLGYMAPEYALEGLYSVKSDVFSFGVLLLEITTGRKNFLGFDCPLPTLIARVWQLWNEGKGLDLMDPILSKDSCRPDEFLRYIHIGLLCVQEDANSRPTMSSIVLMLKTETISLSKPERPAFFTGRSGNNQDQIAANSCTINSLTISDDLPR
ncbi:receptor-like protein kinase [Pyrus ussuriensis x Pyrus communis]|uniref:Receptor-like protein kinase n=1 Tax=Pyrus ussuriensis x Pyrus communis TaxID=2448454 RepID=A0A5N5I842_9ROSA|nr:receptor-like protein kinase [Pyrus ussuriensis x Pyrus communis]